VYLAASFWLRLQFGCPASITETTYNNSIRPNASRSNVRKRNLYSFKIRISDIKLVNSNRSRTCVQPAWVQFQLVPVRVTGGGINGIWPSAPMRTPAKILPRYRHMHLLPVENGSYRRQIRTVFELLTSPMSRNVFKNVNSACHTNYKSNAIRSLALD